jgi:hypothetical protein
MYICLSFFPFFLLKKKNIMQGRIQGGRVPPKIGKNMISDTLIVIYPPLPPYKVLYFTTHTTVRCVQHHVIKFISDLRQVGCFLRVLPPPIKLATVI